MLWLGRLEAGLFLKLKGQGEDWNNPMFVLGFLSRAANESRLPRGSHAARRYGKDESSIPYIPSTWGGQDATVNSTGTAQGVNLTDGEVLAWSGPRSLQPGESVSFLFDLAATPSKPINLARHFRERHLQIGCKCAAGSGPAPHSRPRLA